MTDTATIATTMTLGDYERFVAGRPDGEMWELIGGVAEMMTNPLLNHGLIVGNIFAPLKLKLAGGDGRAFAGGLRVQRSEEATDTFAAIPDMHYRREAEGWILSELVQPSDHLAFDSLGVAMDLAAVYDDAPALRAVAADSEEDPARPIP